jgi:hypothetical protein
MPQKHHHNHQEKKNRTPPSLKPQKHQQKAKTKAQISLPEINRRQDKKERK